MVAHPRQAQQHRSPQLLTFVRRTCHGRRPASKKCGDGLQHLDVRGLPEVVAAWRRWVGVARRAVRAGDEPERVFALADAVAARW